MSEIVSHHVQPETEAPRAPKAHSWASAATDILESPKDFMVVAELPGVTAENVTVEHVDGQLRIRAQQEPLRGQKGPVELRRTLKLKRDVDLENISAELENGLLKVHIPKAASALPRQIEVKSRTR